MQVFQLYMIRFTKRIGILSLVLCLPIIVVLIYYMNEIRQLDYMNVLLTMAAVNILVTWGLTKLFYSDYVNNTNQRILLGANSKMKLFVQTLAFYVTIALAQLMIMFIVLRLVTPNEFTLSWLQLLVLVIAYGLLVIIISGVTSIILHSRFIESPLIRNVIQLLCVASLILGLAMSHLHIPRMLDQLLLLVPTHWVVNITSIVLNDFPANFEQLIIFLSALLLNSLLVIIYLSKLKIKNYKL